MWYIFADLVSFTKENLATLVRRELLSRDQFKLGAHCRKQEQPFALGIGNRKKTKWESVENVLKESCSK
jgi:hypothetical protein